MAPVPEDLEIIIIIADKKVSVTIVLTKKIS